ncbi:MAG TPA: CPBP family glutamic-type intramembrane protease [Jatrophihabitans sp.]|jgi:hypothetical protein
MSAPPTGWYTDPWEPRQLRFWDGQQWSPHTAVPNRYVPQAPALDAAIGAMRQEDARTWGWRPIVAPIGAMIAIIVATQFVGYLEPDSRTGQLIFVAVVNLLITTAVATALYLSGRRVALRHGGWGRTFGWRRPTPGDLPVAGVGFLVATALRIAVGVVLDLASGGAATNESRNIEVDSINVPTVLLLVAVVVIAAPLTEELMFRGLLLRTFMQRWSFWPAAIVSTLIFGLFHTYEVGTVLGAVTLALTVGVMGLVNCYLVRRTNRLMPGILVHAASNGLAVLVLVLTVHNAAFGT